jgi:hypothetical protein
MRHRFIALLFTLQVAVLAQDYDTAKLTVRQVWDNVTTLYGTGHSFTPEEFGQLKAFQKSLTQAGETELSTRLDLLMLAASLENARADTRLETGSQGWELVLSAERRRQDAFFWQTVRNLGLGGFALSTTSALTLAAIWQRSDGKLTTAQSGIEVAFLCFSATLLATLLPVVAGELNQ